MAIHIDSCAARETIVVSTRSSVYELIVLRGNQGHVLVRGGRHFPKFRRALFLGSTTDGVSGEPRIIAIGLRMKFISGHQFFCTSAVRSISRAAASAASTETAATPEPRVPRDSRGSSTALEEAS